MTTSMALMFRAIVHTFFPISQENGQEHQWIHTIADLPIFILMATTLAMSVLALTTYVVSCGLLARNWEDLQ